MLPIDLNSKQNHFKTTQNGIQIRFILANFLLQSITSVLKKWKKGLPRSNELQTCILKGIAKKNDRP